MSRFLDEQLVIAVDFDGTISTEPDMGKPLVLQPDCKRVLHQFHKDGIRLVLWTCRTGEAFDEALDFLQENGIAVLFSAFNEQLPEIEEKYAPNVARKVGADIYIDDKNLGTVIDWNEIENQVYKNFIVN